MPEFLCSPDPCLSQLFRQLSSYLSRRRSAQSGATLIEAVEGLSRDLTLVMIAHRLSTGARCDRAIRLQQGSITIKEIPEMVITST